MSYYGSVYTSMTEAPAPSGYWMDYQWMVVCGGLAAFFMAWGIGANDVANSFATSVGSKTLKLWQAVIIAGVFEFVGAIALGGETTKTVASDISNVAAFTAVPEIYMYGMLCSLTIAGVWLLVATYWLLPVSTTHSIIGAIMGFSLVYGGWDGVLWNGQKGDFPYSKGFLPIVLSWFFSPIIGGILSCIIFTTNRFCILRRTNSTMLAIYSLPVLLFFTFFINLMFVLAKGAKSQMQKTWPCDPKGGPGMFGLYYEDCSALNAASAWIAACVAAGIAIFGGAVGIYLLKKRHTRQMAEEEAKAAGIEDGAVVSIDTAAAATKEGLELDGHLVDGEPPEKSANAALAFPTLAKDASFLQRTWFYATYLPLAFWVQCRRGLFYDIFQNRSMDAFSEAMHAKAEVFNARTERVYQAMQVLSACCVSFAHGSNDVANSIGPFSAIYATYTTYAVPGSKTTTPIWMFVLGGLGIVLGLLMFGYNIIMELGVNMLHLTPSRGFSAELAAGLTISLASFFGIPVSTTQIIVGCEVGVALSEGRRDGLNWRVLLKTFLGWIWTILLSLGFCAILFCMGAYPPSIIQSDQLAQYRTQLLTGQENLLKAINSTNAKWQPNATWWNGTVAAPMPYNGAQLVPQIAKVLNNIKTVKTPKVYVPYQQVMYYVAQAGALYQNYSVTSIGQANATAVLRGDTAYVPQP